MKTLLLAATAGAVAAVLSLSPASAADVQYTAPAATVGTPAATAGSRLTATGTPHWEWQYHYVGHHPRYEGHWVLVR